MRGIHESGGEYFINYHVYKKIFTIRKYFGFITLTTGRNYKIRINENVKVKICFYFLFTLVYDISEQALMRISAFLRAICTLNATDVVISAISANAGI